MTAFYLPELQPTFFLPGTNTPGSGVQLFVYTNLSSTKTIVYKDPGQAVAWSNPIVLDSGGNLPSGGQVFVPSGVTLTIKYAPSNDTDPPASPYVTWNNLTGQNDISSASSEWVLGPTPTFISGISFTLVGDQTASFTAGRRVRTTNTSGTIYSTITNAIFSAGITTIAVTNDSGVLDSGLSAVSYGFLDAAHPSIDYYHVARDGGTVVSASTTDIWGIPGIQVHISSTTPIGSFSTAAYPGAYRTVIADGAFPLINSAILSVPGGTNVTTSVGDRFGIIASTQAAAVITWYQSGLPPGSTLQTSGKVFAGPSSGSTGAVSFRTLVGAESAMVLLAYKIANSSAAISFTTTDMDWVNYDEYEFRFIDFVPTSNGAVINANISNNGGATFISSTNSYTNATQWFNASNSTAVVGTNNTAMLLTPAGDGQMNAGDYGANGVVRMNRPWAVKKKYVSVDMTYNPGANVPGVIKAACAYNTNGLAWNGIQFTESSGFVSSGAIAAYGIKIA